MMTGATQSICTADVVPTSRGMTSRRMMATVAGCVVAGAAAPDRGGERRQSRVQTPQRQPPRAATGERRARAPCYLRTGQLRNPLRPGALPDGVRRTPRGRSGAGPGRVAARLGAQIRLRPRSPVEHPVRRRVDLQDRGHGRHREVRDRDDAHDERLRVQGRAGAGWPLHRRGAQAHVQQSGAARLAAAPPEPPHTSSVVPPFT